MFNFPDSIARYDDGKVFLSLIYERNAYELAISHPLYNDDKIIIVNRYISKSDALKDFNNYKLILTSDSLPDKLCGYDRKG